MKLYLDCQTGISGDMFVAAMLDLGVDEIMLKRQLDSLPLCGYRIEISRVKKAGLDVCDFNVILDEAHENHDHDMDYLYGHEHVHNDGHGHEHSHGDGHGHEHSHGDGHGHEHVNGDGHGHEHVNGDGHGHEHVNGDGHGHEHSHGDGHSHEHVHEHGHHGHTHSHVHGHHAHRGLKEILEILRSGSLSSGALKLAERIFGILAEAEARAHGIPAEEVHFHEVGAVDSIVDIAAAAICVDALQIEGCIVQSLSEGHGSVRCQHGIMPVPVPAVMHIAESHGLRLRQTEMPGELITPTGAAIVAAICTERRLPSEYYICRSGMGAGKRRYERPSLLRAVLIQTAEMSDPGIQDGAPEIAVAKPWKADTEKASAAEPQQVDTAETSAAESQQIPQTDEVWRLETNLDDCSGEALGRVMQLLLDNGARDVFFTPIYMKKNRPAYQLSVLCAEAERAALEQLIFSETSTIGIRRQRMERSILPRTRRQLETRLGTLDLKCCTLPDGRRRMYPEFESMRKLCEQSGLPFEEVYALCIAAIVDSERKDGL